MLRSLVGSEMCIRDSLETFSPYIRQFLDKIKKPEISSSENIRPAIAIQQKTKINSSRSSVGSLTDVNDYLTIIYSNIAVPFHPNTNQELIRHSAKDVFNILGNHKADTQEVIYICAKIELITKKKELQEQIKNLEQMGFHRFLIKDDPTCLLYTSPSPRDS